MMPKIVHLKWYYIIATVNKCVHFRLGLWFGQAIAAKANSHIKMSQDYYKHSKLAESTEMAEIHEWFNARNI